MTKRGQYFTELVHQLAHKDFKDAMSMQNAPQLILGILEEDSKGIFDPNELINKFGKLTNRALAGDSKVTICKALTIYSNYEYLSKYNTAYVPCEKSWYGDVIVNALTNVVFDCDIEEAYGRVGDFVS